MINIQKQRQYWELYRYVKDHPYSSKKKIINHLEEFTDTIISDRTFWRIKKEIEELGIELEYHHKKGYTIQETDSSLFKGIGSFVQAMSSIGFLSSNYSNFKEMLSVVRISESAFKGNENLELLIQSCLQSKEIRFNHFHFQDDVVREKIVQPYQVRENDGRWYLIGIEPESPIKTLKAFGIDRMIDVKNTGQKFKRNTKIDPDKHYEDLVGLWSGKNEETKIIKLRTDKVTWNYIDGLKWHHSQKKLNELDGFVEFELMVKPTQDLIKLIMQWMPKVEVISPKILKERVLKLLNDSIKIYK